MLVYKTRPYAPLQSDQLPPPPICSPCVDAVGAKMCATATLAKHINASGSSIKVETVKTAEH